MKRRTKNKGFTLIELIIAMTILSVIVVPLLRAFVLSALTNAKASKIQRATTCAQNFIETLKSTTVSDMALSVYGFTDDEDGNSVTAFPVSSFTGKDAYGGDAVFKAFESKNGIGGLYIQTEDPCVTKATLGGRFTSPAREGDQLNFVFPNVEQNGRYYDLVLELTSGKTATDVNLSATSEKGSLYLAQADNLADEAANSFATANAAYANAPGSSTLLLNKSQFEQRMTRKVTIDISSSSSSVMVTMVTDFDCGVGYTSSDKRHYQITETNIHDKTEGDLSAIYVFYYPLYGNAFVRDSFIVNNLENLDVDIFFIAMENSDYTVANMERYRASVVVNERLIASEYQGANARTAIHTSLLSNVTSTQWSVTDNNTSVNTAMKSLGESEEGTFMYHLNVLVYEHDDDAFESNGGKLRFMGDEKKKITGFEGSALE